MRLGRTVDLTRPLDDTTMTFPGDPVAVAMPHNTVARDGYNLMDLRMGTHTGTHVDAPRHVDDAGVGIDAVPLPQFLGPAVVLDVRGYGSRESINAEPHTAQIEAISPGTIVLVHTGWGQHYGSTHWFGHPHVAADVVRQLLARGVRTIGVDTPSIDAADADGHSLVNHRLIAAAGGVVLENLTGLGDITWPDPWVSCLPLRLTGADGSPCRAVAFEALAR